MASLLAGHCRISHDPLGAAANVGPGRLSHAKRFLKKVLDNGSVLAVLSVCLAGKGKIIMPRKGYKKRNCVISTGVAFRPITRAKLELVAAGLDRSVGWVVRDAVDYYLQTRPSQINTERISRRWQRSWTQRLRRLAATWMKSTGQSYCKRSMFLASRSCHLGNHSCHLPRYPSNRAKHMSK